MILPLEKHGYSEYQAAVTVLEYIARDLRSAPFFVRFRSSPLLIENTSLFSLFLA